jgi:hypothetical protein
MAATAYTSKNAVTTQAGKRLAYEKIISLINHLEAFGVDLTALSLNADKTISVTLTGPLPPAQLDHLGLT